MIALRIVDWGRVFLEVLVSLSLGVLGYVLIWVVNAWLWATWVTPLEVGWMVACLSLGLGVLQLWGES